MSVTAFPTPQLKDGCSFRTLIIVNYLYLITLIIEMIVEINARLRREVYIRGPHHVHSVSIRNAACITVSFIHALHVLKKFGEGGYPSGGFSTGGVCSLT